MECRQISHPLSVTSLFWGAGATLQFLVLKWGDHAFLSPEPF